VVFDEPSPMDTTPSPPAPEPAVSDIAPPGPPGPPAKPPGPDGVVVISAPRPPYPRDALRAGIEGTVVLRIAIDANGKPTDVSIEKSSGNRDLDREAMSHVKRKWRFQATGYPQLARLPVAFSIN